MKNNKILLLAVIATIISAWFYFDLSHFLTLEYAKREQLALQHHITENPVIAYVSFFSLYVLVTALSIPGASILTLLGAALFGFWTSLIIVSFASTIGATLAFLSSRFILRDWVQSKFGHRLATLNKGIEKEGAFYLLSLRLIPVFPFFLINLLMGLTSIKTRTFFWVSQLGMLAGTAVYINAGTQLGKIESLSGIISAPVLTSLFLLGLFPLIVKWVMKTMKNKKRYQQWQQPTHFDQNLVVIGA